MKIHEIYIRRCLELAKKGLTLAAPNPSVGCVIVYNDLIIGEGYTSAYGGAHAEVNAIAAVKEPSMLKNATLYVSLEPCSHFGKTPPCTDLIIKSGIKKVVIGCIDPNHKVSGRGVLKLKEHGCSVITGVLERECTESHRRFFTFQTKKRPYIILKWAQSKDGFIDIDRSVHSSESAKPTWITSKYSRQLVHKWRSEEAAILVGTNTALKDNPSLTTRDWHGSNPVRFVLDRQLRIPTSYQLFNREAKTVVFTELVPKKSSDLTYEKINFSEDLAQQISTKLFEHELASVIIEGGAKTLQTFIDANLWDEARIFTGPVEFSTGIPAPTIDGRQMLVKSMGQDRLQILKPTL